MFEVDRRTSHKTFLIDDPKSIQDGCRKSRNIKVSGEIAKKAKSFKATLTQYSFQLTEPCSTKTRKSGKSVIYLTTKLDDLILLLAISVNAVKSEPGQTHQKEGVPNMNASSLPLPSPGHFCVRVCALPAYGGEPTCAAVCRGVQSAPCCLYRMVHVQRSALVGKQLRSQSS